MSISQLPNHLRANRKRLALSQDEVAFLLGGASGTLVSRYEHFERAPSLETALAYEVIFKRSASELFGGVYQRAERGVAEREQSLLMQLEGQPGSRARRKREALAELAGISG